MFCQMCGSKLPEGARMCPICGAPIQGFMQNQSQENQSYQNQSQVNQSQFNQGQVSQPQAGQAQYNQPQAGQTQINQQQAGQAHINQIYGGYPQGNQPQGNPSQRDFSQGNYDDQSVSRSSKNRLDKKTLIVVAISVISIIVALSVLFFVKLFYVPTVSLDRYVTIEAKGYSSVGTATVMFDEDSFYKDFDNSIKYKAGGPADADSYYNAAECLFKEFLSGELDKSTNISNGDTITYVWNIDETAVSDFFKVKLEIEDISYKVSGLSEAETFDMFQDISVEFEGSSSEGKIRIYNDSSIYPVSNWTFVADKAEGLSNGDKVNVYVENADEKIKECLDEYGKIPNATTKEFEVSGLTSAAASINQIPDETMALMKKTVEDGLTTRAAADWYDEISLDRMTYIGAYFLKAKPDSDADNENTIKLVYAIDTSIDRETDDQSITGTYGFYYFGEFNNLTMNDDGTCNVDLGDCLIPDSNAILKTKSREYYFDGYEDYKTLFEKEVTAYADKYDYESTVNETVKPVEEDMTYKDNAKTDSKKASKKKKDSGSDDGQIFPDSSTRYLTDAEVKKLSDSQIQTAINEIYARNGYKFQDQDIYNYFSQYSWYKPKTNSQDDVKRRFSDIENKNVEMLQKYR